MFTPFFIIFGVLLGLGCLELLLEKLNEYFMKKQHSKEQNAVNRCHSGEQDNDDGEMTVEQMQAEEYHYYRDKKDPDEIIRQSRQRWERDDCYCQSRTDERDDEEMTVEEMQAEEYYYYHDRD